jgi:hypothetical protein
MTWQWRLPTLVIIIIMIANVNADYRVPGDDDVWDYIVIGGGTSGSMVAGRLAQAGFTVLLLEAGDRTQSELGGRDYIMPDQLTIFDVPSQWIEIPNGERWSKYRWPTLDTPRVGLVVVMAATVFESYDFWLVAYV